MNYITMNNAYAKSNFLSSDSSPKILFSENNNQISPEKTIQEVWSKYKFDANNVVQGINELKTTWATDKMEQEIKVEDEEEEEISKEKEEETSPSHHARRPMNAFLIFCKKHRPIVRERFPNLENRGVTRILGEWWALLDEKDKAPYTSLAKEYKDAFLSANPNFKWYKLPAPPLRTLNVRPQTQKVASPVSSPNHTISVESEFTPGKLADESQLGSLTSLMNNNFVLSKPEIKTNENNNNIEKHGVNSLETSLPPKPFKKRSFDGYPDNNGCVDLVEHAHDDSHMTNQDLMDKVVDKIFTKPDQDDYDIYQKETRKSGRQCKGKRYEKFMVEGRLLGHKRDGKLTSQKIENELIKLPEPETPNLDHTIKRLAERTNMKSILDNPKTDEKNERIRTEDTSFNLNQRIDNLPSLSYDVFHQRKRESKKRKNKIKTDGEPKNKVVKVVKNDQLVGSKKRKNKQSITHLKEEVSNVGCDLLALATLAEIAANTQKINSE